MKVKAKPGALPNRDALMAWGLAPCEGEGCRVLVNAEVLRPSERPAGRIFCSGCRKAHRKGRPDSKGNDDDEA